MKPFSFSTLLRVYSIPAHQQVGSILLDILPAFLHGDMTSFFAPITFIYYLKMIEVRPSLNHGVTSLFIHLDIKRARWLDGGCHSQCGLACLIPISTKPSPHSTYHISHRCYHANRLIASIHAHIPLSLVLSQPTGHIIRTHLSILLTPFHDRSSR